MLSCVLYPKCSIRTPEARSWRTAYIVEASAETRFCRAESSLTRCVPTATLRHAAPAPLRDCLCSALYRRLYLHVAHHTIYLLHSIVLQVAKSARRFLSYVSVTEDLEKI
jgi:hypothetical protein